MKNKIQNIYILYFIVIAVLVTITICLYNNFTKSYKELDVINEENLLWYEKYHVIAHSLGGIDGYAYTNSLEAFEKSYNNGIRIFDADLEMTSDNVYVLRHGWQDNMGIKYSSGLVPTYNEFMQNKIHYKYTPLSLNDFLKIMEFYPDIYVAFDAKGNICEMYKDLVNIAIDENMEYILDRIIVSFYKYEDFYKLQEIYPFKNYAIRYYENDPKNVDELILFCLENKINVVNIKMLYINQDKNWQKLIDNGLTVYAAIVNDNDTYSKLSNKGVFGVVSDTIKEPRK